MTVSNIQPQSAPSQPAPSLQGLRDALEQAERQFVRLDRTNIQGFLLLMDKIEQMWSGYDDPSSMRGEEARWQSLLKRIATSPQTVIHAAAQVGGLTKLRSQNPPATGMWWHVDEQVSGQRQQMWRRLLPIAGIVVLVVVAFWLFNTFMSHNTAAAADSSQQIEQLVEAQNWKSAQTAVQGALQKSPNDANLLMWQAVLAEQLGDKALAQTSLTQAQAKFAGTAAAFWTQVGNDRLQTSNWDGAEEAGQKALALTPNDGEVTFLLGRVAEGRGDMAKANDYYNQTMTLAGNSNPSLVALVKVRMGMMMQSAPALPGPAPTPPVTQTVTQTVTP